MSVFLHCIKPHHGFNVSLENVDMILPNIAGIVCLPIIILISYYGGIFDAGLAVSGQTTFNMICKYKVMYQKPDQS